MVTHSFRMKCPFPGTVGTGYLGPIPVAVVHTDDGELFALMDRCPHQGGTLSRGRLGLTVSQGAAPGEYRLHESLVLQCPWHGYEYDVSNGCLLSDPRKRLRMFKIAREDDEVVVTP
jgi:nitrite reductase/ring-hydroxylating ferredoxin subunit